MPPRSTPDTPFAGTPAPGEPIQETESLSELDRIIEECGPGTDWTVAIFRKSPDGLRWDYCCRIPLQGFTPDVLPQKIGGGTFLMKVTNARNKIAKTLQMSFDPVLHPYNPPAPPAATSPAVDFQTQLLVKMAEQRDRDRDQQTAFLQTLITALAGRNAAPAGASLTELVQGVAALKALSGPDQAATPVNVIMEALRAGLELRGEAGDEKESVDPVMRLLEKVIPGIMAAAANRPGPPPLPLTATPAGKASPVAKPDLIGAAQPATSPVAPELEPYLWLRKYLPTFLGWAKAGVSPRRAANVIDNLVPEGQLPLLEQLLSMEPGPRHSLFVQLEPRLQPYRGYLDEICQELLTDEGEDDLSDEKGPDTATPTH